MVWGRLIGASLGWNGGFSKRRTRYALVLINRQVEESHGLSPKQAQGKAEARQVLPGVVEAMAWQDLSPE